jgi:argininosuccinate lyase
LVGDAGKRAAHRPLAQSTRVATDVRCGCASEIDAIARCWPTCSARDRLWHKHHTVTVMPGFTHTQVAQPVSFAHHLLAYVEMFARDGERLARVRKARESPAAGAAALWPAPATHSTAKRRHGARASTVVCQNSLDAVSDRDFAIEIQRASPRW